jgi:branched-chain amino acid aminotransferase
MMKGRRVFFNGEFVDESEARLSIYDSALMFGDMVFEMTRSFNWKQFRLKEHIDRLIASVRYLRIPLVMKAEEMENLCLQTVEENRDAFAPDDEHRLMINVTRGILGIYDGVVGVASGTNVIIADFPLRWTVRGMGHLFDEGIHAVIPHQRSIPSQLLEPKVKSRSRIHLMMANIQASRVKGNDNWPLMLDPDGFVSEGTGDNFFIVRGRTFVTPEPRNILRGISRDEVLLLAHELKYQVIERNIEPYDVLEADEAFMTGTPFCMLPVVSLDGTPIGSGKPGQMYKALLEYWSYKVDLDIKGQIQAWDEEGGCIPQGTTPYQFQG